MELACSISRLLDDAVGLGQDLRGDFKANGSSSLEVHRHPEGGGHLHREITRLGPF